MNMQKLGTLGQSEKGFRNRENLMNTGLRAIHYANIKAGKVGRSNRHTSWLACSVRTMPERSVSVIA